MGDMRGSDDRVSGETCSGEEHSTGGTTPEREKAHRAGAGVGGLGSSEDLWDRITQRERSETTCSAVAKSGKGRGDGPQGLPTPDKVRQLQITLYRKAWKANRQRNSESRMRENRTSGLMRGGSQTVIGCTPFQSVGFRLLYKSAIT